MNEFECLENEKFIILKNRELMIDLLHETCLKGLNCLCFLESLSKEDLVQKLLLKQAEIDINQNLTKEDYKLLVQAIHDICNLKVFILIKSCQPTFKFTRFFIFLCNQFLKFKFKSCVFGFKFGF